MKIRRIHENELARITVRPIEEQPKLLSKLKGFRPTHSLNPFRNLIPDLLNIGYGLAPASGLPKWEIIENIILSSKESEFGKEMNLEAARALYNFAVDNSIVSFSKPTPNWAIGFNTSVSYWQQSYSIWGDKPRVLYIDPRKSAPLTKSAMRFVFSLMHERIRVDDPDFSEVDLNIMRIVAKGDGTRNIKLYSADDFDLYNRDQLNEMITTTYQLWIEELKGREGKRRAG